MSTSHDVADEHIEELEQIPWGMLAADLRGARRFSNATILVAIGVALIAAIVGVVVFRQPGEVIEIDPVEADAASSPATADSPLGAGEPPPALEALEPLPSPGADKAVPSPSSLSAPTLYREADLMAVVTDEELRAAATVAEIFVAGHFTLDGISSPLDLPEGLPESRPAADGGSAWVERIHTTHIEPDDHGGYVVSVVFQIMAAGPSGGFQRLPLRAVTVPVAMQPDGVMAVTDLPSPTATAGSVPVVAPDLGAALDLQDDVPPHVLEAAIDDIPWDGAEVRTVAAHPTSTGWRVTLEVDAGSAGAVPVVVTVDE